MKIKFCTSIFHTLNFFAGIEALAHGCRKIKSFIAKGVIQITDRAISCLAQSCPDLETLILHGCTVSRFYKMNMNNVSRGSGHSDKINGSISFSQNLEDKAVISLAENCKNLQYLCLSGCNRLTDASLIILAQQCHQLSTLEVAGCSQFTDAGFQALSRVCSKLDI